jgi:hypothetical protein
MKYCILQRAAPVKASIPKAATNNGVERFTAPARGSGRQPTASWTDADGMFSVHTLVAEG